MGKSISTILLAIGALVMVGAGALVIGMTALGDSGDESDSSAGSALSGEQHVYLMNLGMTWRSCAGAVASELDSINGVLEHDTNFSGDYVELRYDADVVSIEEIEDELDGIGYRPQSVRDVEDKN